jgi:ATP-dependent helicase HepA
MSTAEPELGLGLVLEVDRRQVRLFFPATEEARVYSVDSAPIERVLFKKGDKVRSQAGKAFKVEATEEAGGLVHYVGEGERCSEADLADSINLATADRRLLDGRPDSGALFRLRRQAWEQRSRMQRHPAHGYVGARMDLIPHQLYIAHEVAERKRPRVLLSDEVGLGKTIEACLILQRLYVRGQSGRVLILVPEPLIHQWFVELYRRFNLTCAIFDEERCLAIAGAEGAANPFLDEHLILTSTSLFGRHPERLRQALAADWGLVIVDEAHHLRWSPQASSPEYRMAEAFARAAPGLLLLTGTPEQFGLEGHFARLHLLDPERYHDYEGFVRETESYRKIAELAGHLVGGEALTAKDRKHLEKLLPGQGGLPLETAIDELLDRHGPGRAVFRNTRAAIPGFPKRKVHPAPLAFPPAEREPDAEEIVRHEIEVELGLTDKQIRRRMARDPRVEWLVRLLKKHPEEKFLLICRYQKRAEALYEAVRERLEVPLAVFHEDQTLLQRDRNAAWFAKPAPDGARVLICSEIGSEGRNFQFAHHLVLYDLPADPELLEQRIGRLDRIGQRETIHLHVPYFKGSGGEMLFRWYQEGIDAFSHPIQGGALMLERFKPGLCRLLEGKNGIDPGALDALVRETARFRAELKRKFEQGRDRLQEWNSCRPAKIQPLLDSIRALDQGAELPAFLLSAFDHFGIHVERLDGRDGPGGEEGRSWVLTPGHLMTDQLTLIPPEGKMVTLDRKVALDRDDVEFLTWDHPLVASVLDLLLGSDAGNAAFSQYPKSEALPAGLYLEILHVLEVSCPPRFDAGRFLPATPIRTVLDLKGQVVGEAGIQALEASVPADAPKSALEGQAAALKKLLDQWKERAESLAEQQAEALKQAALQAAGQALTRELDRLRALQEKNGRGETQENAMLREEKQVLLESIAASRIRLDALRLIRVG